MTITNAGYTTQFATGAGSTTHNSRNGSHLKKDEIEVVHYNAKPKHSAKGHSKAEIEGFVPVHGQEVYVQHRKFKAFGKLIAVNGKAYGVVALDGRALPLAFPAKEIISM